MKVLSVINNDKDAVTKEYVDSKAGVTAVDPTSGPVETDFFIPTKTSELTNDSGFITEAALATKQETLVSGTNIKTINNQSLLGSGNINISGGGSLPTDVRINGTSITSNDIADIKTNGTYNATSNKIATMSDLPTKVSDLTNDSGFIDNTYHDSTKQNTLVSGTNIKTINNESILGSGNINISGGGGTATDVQVNGTSITSSGVANLLTNSAYNSSSNKIATMTDVSNAVASKLDGN